MVSWGSVEWAVVGVILLALVASSGALGGDSAAGQGSQAVGEGTATVAVESLPTDRLRIDDGRFGTGVRYLRVPDVRVRVEAVDADPRIVYRVQVPALGVDDAATRSLTGTAGQTVSVRGVDRAFDPGQVSADRYEAVVTVRVQSFDVDETVVSVNETVEVTR